MATWHCRFEEDPDLVCWLDRGIERSLLSTGSTRATNPVFVPRRLSRIELSSIDVTLTHCQQMTAHL